MDVPRQKPRRRRAPLYLGAAAALALTTVGIARLQPAAPGVDRTSLVIDTVKRGEMVRQVHGTGTLVPEDLRVVSALTAGRVDRVLVQPGAHVDAATVVLEMSNPDVQLQSLDAERQVKLAEADLASLRATLETQRLAAVSALAAVRTELHEAERGIKVAERLSADGLGSAMDVDRARDKADETRARYASQQSQLDVVTAAVQAQVALREAEVERLRAIARFQRERVASMTVRAGQAGMVQSLDLEPGAWVNPGQELARVAGQERLKAVVHVPEAQARDLTTGLPAVVDTRVGLVKGHVARVDAAVENGALTVDVAFDAPLPRGARPDLSVDATIEIERLPDVLYVGPPADGSSEATVRLFRLDPGGATATRVPVRLGRGSADAVEVLAGLKAGDQVILSEMSRYDTKERVRLQ